MRGSTIFCWRGEVETGLVEVDCCWGGNIIVKSSGHALVLSNTCPPVCSKRFRLEFLLGFTDKERADRL